jgi:hypothetical protein
LGYNKTGSDGYFREIPDGLVDTKAPWDILSKAGGGEWGMASMLAGLRVENGVAGYSYKAFTLLKFPYARLIFQQTFIIIYNLCNDCTGTGRTPFNIWSNPVNL